MWSHHDHTAGSTQRELAEEYNFIVLNLVLLDEVAPLAGHVEIATGSDREIPGELPHFEGTELLQLALLLLVEDHHLVVAPQTQVDPAAQVLHFGGKVQLVLGHFVCYDLLELVILVAQHSQCVVQLAA